MEEDLRLQELRKYDILHSPPEESFDRITKVAKRIFNVPIVLISFVDQDIEWFKSCIGVNFNETSRDISFCSHALASDEALVIPDATADARFADNPLVTQPPSIRFYAGAPMITMQHFRLGTVCLIDTVPHVQGLTDEEKKVLADLACMAISQLELRLANKAKLETIKDLEAAEERLKQTNECLRKATADLERSNQDLARFAHVCSHDLKAPARTTSRSLQLLMKRSSGHLDSESKQDVQSALDSANRMVTLVDDVLALSKAVSSEDSTTIKDVDTNRVFRSVMDNLSLAIRDAGADVTCDNLPPVRINPQSLLQVFQNLISNAINYRGERRPIIHVSCQTKGREQVFCVEDNGIGIDAAYREKIFEPFKRLHGTEREGTGLGLSICKSVAERAGGRMWVESVVGQGSKFFFSLPNLVAEPVSRLQ